MRTPKGLSSLRCKHGTLFNQYPISYVYYIHSELTDEQQILYFDRVITGSYEYYGDDCVEHFVEAINNLNTGFSTFYNSAKYKECNLTTEEEHEFQQSKLCHLCDKEIYPHTGNKDFKKVRDHCHYTGKFRGAAHSCCNITATEKKQSFVPILFHNGSGYDFHLFIDQLVSKAHEVFWAETKDGVMVSKFDQNFKLLSKNDEEYISITYGKMRFLDSFRFLSSSLDKLGKSLDDFPIMKKVLGESFDKILTTKLAFPYEYFNTSEDDSKVLLLTKKDFYSHIRQGYPTDEEINRTFEIIKKYNLKTKKDFLMFYNKLDTLLLADIMNQFNNSCMEYYSLSPLNCYSLPGFGWNAMLKMTEVNLDYINNNNDYLRIEKGIRGGLSGVMGDRYYERKEENIVIMNPTYHEIFNFKPENCSDKNIDWGSITILGDDNHEDVKNCKAERMNLELLYIDKNNLYGEGMSQALPYELMSVVDCVDFTPEQQYYLYQHIMNIPDDADVGCFVECDLEYPDNIKYKTRHFPLAISKRAVEWCELSSEQQEQWMKLNNNKNVYKATEKLVADQHHKYKYVLHYRLLKLFVNLGMIVRRMHSVQWFKQSSWLKSYIDFNTEKRKNAKTDFEKDLFKLMNNAVYGKTMEDVKNRVNIKFVPKDDSEKCMKEVSKLSFNRFKEFDNYNAYHHTKQLVKLDKPMYLGAAILDLSKLSMYDDFYNKFQPYWGIDNLQMHYTDTDSMNLSFWTPDLNTDLEYFKDHFDFSNAPKDHPLYDKSNEKVIGKQKLELWDKPKEAVFIRSKMYSHCLDLTKIN